MLSLIRNWRYQTFVPSLSEKGIDPPQCPTVTA